MSPDGRSVLADGDLSSTSVTSPTTTLPGDGSHQGSASRPCKSGAQPATAKQVAWLKNRLQLRQEALAKSSTQKGGGALAAASNLLSHPQWETSMDWSSGGASASEATKNHAAYGGEEDDVIDYGYEYHHHAEELRESRHVESDNSLSIICLPHRRGSPKPQGSAQPSAVPPCSFTPVAVRYLSHRLRYLSQFRCTQRCPVDLLSLLVSPFCLVSDVLRLRLCNRRIYYRTLALSRLCLKPLSPLSQDLMISVAFPTIRNVLKPKSFAYLDFTHCCGTRDALIAALLLPPPPQQQSPPADALPSPPLQNYEPLKTSPSRGKPFLSSLRVLCLDFCYLLTDKSLENIFAADIPHLECLSLRCARSKDLTGAPFSSEGVLSAEVLPRLHHFICSYTCFELQHLQKLFPFLAERAHLIDANRQPSLWFNGSLASTTLVSRLGLTAEYSKFSRAVRRGTACEVNEAIVDFEAKWSAVQDRAEIDSVTRQLARIHAAKFLVTCPCTTAEPEVLSGASSSPITPSKPTSTKTTKPLSVWTYPILVAIRRMKLDVVLALLRCPTSLDGWGYEYETPLYVACAATDLISTAHPSVHPSPPPSSLVANSSDRAAGGDASKIFYEILARVLLVDGLRTSAPEKWPLCAAAARGNAAYVSNLLRRGASPNFRIATAATSLVASCPPLSPPVAGQTDQTAATSGSSSASTARDSMGAQLSPSGPPRVVWRRYSPALLFAVEAGSIECVELLLEAGADPNGVVTLDGSSQLSVTPTLHCYKKLPDALPLFLRFGAGATEGTRGVLIEVLAAAVTSMDVTTVRRLAKMYPDLLSREHAYKSLPLLQAASAGSTEMISCLLEAGADPNRVSSAGEAAIHRAAASGQCNAIEALIANHADPNIQSTRTGATALHICCKEFQLGCIEVLCRAGANPNTFDFNHHTPLMTTITSRQEPAALALLNSCEGGSLNIDACDNSGRTAFIIAIYFGLFQIADALLEAGASCVAQDKEGVSSIQFLEKKLAGFADYLNTGAWATSTPPDQQKLMDVHHSQHAVHGHAQAAPAAKSSQSFRRTLLFRKFRMLLSSRHVSPDKVCTAATTQSSEKSREGDDGEQVRQEQYAEELSKGMQLHDKILRFIALKVGETVPVDCDGQNPPI